MTPGAPSGCPAHFYSFASRPALDDFRLALAASVPAHAEVDRLAAATPEVLAARLAALVDALPAVQARKARGRRE